MEHFKILTLNNIAVEGLRRFPRNRYEVASESRVTLDIVDVSGRRVRRLVSTVLPAGAYEATWDGRDDGGRELASGVCPATSTSTS